MNSARREQCQTPDSQPGRKRLGYHSQLALNSMPSRQASTPSQKRFWLLDLTREERATLIATFGGWGLDGMDVMIYSFVIPSLMAQWQMNQGQAGILSTVALVISALGGWLAGILADRFGRARILQLTIVWFAVFTFLSGFTHTFWQLLVARALQGIGFGGEWAVGAVLMGEAIRAEHRGKAVGTVQAGWAIGWGVAAAFYTLLFSILPPSLAWRVMFWIGILPSLLVFYIQHRVPEPEIFQKTRADHTRNGGGSSFLEIFGPPLLRTTLLASLLAVGAQGGYYAITTWLPTYLKTTSGLSVLNTGAYLSVVIAGSFFGYLAGAWLTDFLGRKRTLILFALCSLLAALAYTYVPPGNTLMLVLGFPLGFFPSGAFSPIGAFFTELFPTRLRGSGQGFSYNVGRGLGALFPTLVGYLSTRMGLGHAISAFAVCAYFTIALAAFFLPETRGSDLTTAG